MPVSSAPILPVRAFCRLLCLDVACFFLQPLSLISEMCLILLLAYCAAQQTLDCLAVLEIRGVPLTI